MQTELLRIRNHAGNVSTRVFLEKETTALLSDAGEKKNLKSSDRISVATKISLKKKENKAVGR